MAGRCLMIEIKCVECFSIKSIGDLRLKQNPCVQVERRGIGLVQDNYVIVKEYMFP